MELLLCVDMEKVWLRVKTVPASDPITNELHTAFTVSFYNDADSLQFVCAWTLRDAIEQFSLRYHVERQSLFLLRPFFPQKWEDDGDRII